MKRNTQYVDVFRMLEAPKCAIICRTIEDACLLYDSISCQLPEYSTLWSPDDLEYVWNVNESKTGFSLYSWDNEPEPLSYCDEEWFRGEGYVIIEFSDLCDIPDLEEGDLPIGFLLGGVQCS